MLHETTGVPDKFYWRTLRRLSTRIACFEGTAVQKTWTSPSAVLTTAKDVSTFQIPTYGNYTGSKLHPNTLPQVSLFLYSFFFFFFWPHHDVVCRILVPGPGINKPACPAMEAWRLNRWTTREVPFLLLFSESIYLFGFAKSQLQHVGS